MTALKVQDLSGPLLARAVAMVLNLTPVRGQPKGFFHWEHVLGTPESGFFSPHEDWAHGGPLLDQYHFWISDDGSEEIIASLSPHVNDAIQKGSTVLEAICRALVYDEFGDTMPEDFQ